ncbi:hypothetical protein IJZ97_06000 [bacterium]|nr:hypothetical protein [bacterium]
MTGIPPIKDFAGFSVNTQFNNKPFEKQQRKKDYSDPLMKWPIRGMAFSNDIGAAIMDIAPKAGTLFWIPALMYFGADIYDKYKNDKDSYDPSAKRGFKQATFQAFASIIFPIAAVHLGQKLTSLGARLGKTGLSIQTQEEIIQHHKEYMSNHKLGSRDIVDYKTQYGLALDNYIDETMRNHKKQNPVKKVINTIFGGRHKEELGKGRRTKVHEYINQKIDDMFEIRNQLLQDKQPETLSVKNFLKFQTLKAEYKKNPAHVNDFAQKAAKDTLRTIEDAKVFKLKLLKTFGGFVALGALIQPIDNFVEHVIIDKFVDPSLKRFDAGQVKDFKEKMMKS